MDPDIVRQQAYDFMLLRNPQQVSFYSRISPGTSSSFTAGSPYTLYNATNQIQDRDVKAPGSTRHTTADWWLYIDDLSAAGAPNPKVDDLITESSGDVWTVKKVDYNTMVGIFSCECVKQVPVNQTIN